jgi:hypothetical protein
LINLRSDCSLPHLCSAPHLSSQPSGSTAPLRSRSSSQLDTHSYNLRSRGVSTNLVSEMSGSNTDDGAASATQASELAAITTALAEVQRQLGAFATQMSSMSSRIAAVETPPASSALSLPTSCPYGLPGYGGIPPTTTPTDDVPPPSSQSIFYHCHIPLRPSHIIHHLHCHLSTPFPILLLQKFLVSIASNLPYLMARKTPSSGSIDANSSLKVSAR